ncbi:MAG: 30S ribosomal protein S12 methylthiotransferase RimO, partial [Phycisphaerae bacterium]
MGSSATKKVQSQPAKTGKKAGEPKIRSVAFVSLGCPKNLVDSERMLGLLAEDGLAITPDASQADAIVINTCGFLEASKDESMREINDAVAL